MNQILWRTEQGAKVLARKNNASQATRWWIQSASSEGPSILDALVSSDDSWQQVVETGNADFDRARQAIDLPLGSDLSLLEIGCGAGRMTSALADHYGRVTGIDVSPELIRMAKRNCRADNVLFRVLEGDSLISACHRQYDVIFSYEVFHYLEAIVLRRYLFQAKHLLKPGGMLAIQLNTRRLGFRTRLSRCFRRVLHLLGVKHWRGWPTNPQFFHKVHKPDWLINTLRSHGFSSIRAVHPGTRCTWFVAANEIAASDAVNQRVSSEEALAQ